jgi:hypothetical protein
MSSKIIYLSGTLTGGLNYKPYPTNEFSKGTWNFTISQLIYDCSPSTVSTKSIAVGLKCNFVKAYKYSENNEIEYH